MYFTVPKISITVSPKKKAGPSESVLTALISTQAAGPVGRFTGIKCGKFIDNSPISEIPPCALF